MAEVVTGEAVVLEVPWARLPSRLLARGLDTLIQFGLLLLLVFLIAAASGGGLDPAAAAAAGLTGYVLIVAGYPVIWETSTRGATPGKYAVGLRVVGDDGSPVRFRQALVRGLAGVLEIWALLGLPALLCSLLSADGKRIGDFLAGTRVIQRRLPQHAPLAAAFATVPPALAGWAQSLVLASLSDASAESARQYLSRYAELTPAAREELGRQLAIAIAGQVSPPPPPGTHPAGYLAAVLAERNRRARARPGYGAGGWVPPAAPPPYPHAGYPQAGYPHAYPAAPGASSAGDQPPPQPGPTPATPPGSVASPDGFSPPV